MLARITQLADIFADSRLQIDQGYFHQAILGDLNTMAHGIARLSPNYCGDRMRILSVGRDEAVVWERSVLSITDPRYDPTRDSEKIERSSVAETSAPREESGPEQPAAVNAALLQWGVAPEFAQDATNPGFSCPFEASKTVTLDNPAYKWFGISFMKGKLDWTLLRRVRWVKKEIGNLNYELSDHRWLLVEGVLE